MSSRMIKKSCSGVTGLLVLLLLICLVETSTEQRINNRGSKAASLIEKVNGWRSQRGGSCLSYGHSCWGAHGKRSDKSPSSAPDWYLTKILRRMAAHPEMNNARRVAVAGNYFNDILPSDAVNNVAPLNNAVFNNDEAPFELRARNVEAKPMLDDSLLTNMKIWQLMRQTSDEK